MLKSVNTLELSTCNLSTRSLGDYQIHSLRRQTQKASVLKLQVSVLFWSVTSQNMRALKISVVKSYSTVHLTIPFSALETMQGSSKSGVRKWGLGRGRTGGRRLSQQSNHLPRLKTQF